MGDVQTSQQGLDARWGDPHLFWRFSCFPVIVGSTVILDDDSAINGGALVQHHPEVRIVGVLWCAEVLQAYGMKIFRGCLCMNDQSLASRPRLVQSN